MNVIYDCRCNVCCSQFCKWTKIRHDDDDDDVIGTFERETWQCRPNARPTASCMATDWFKMDHGRFSRITLPKFCY